MTRRVRAALFAAVASSAVSQFASAAVVFSGANLTENFDTLATTGSTTIATGIGVQGPVSNLTTWDAAQVAGTTSTAFTMIASTGSANTGALYSFGAASGSDRALGALASGGKIAAFGLQITNSGTDAIESFTLTYTAEEWRTSQSIQNVLAFAYGSTSTFGTATASGYLSDTDLIAVTALNATGKAATGTAGAADGNLVANQTAISSTVTLSTPLPVGQSLFLRWTDTDETGSDGGVGIDGLTFSATFVPEPAMLGALGLLGGLFVRRRRQ